MQADCSPADGLQFICGPVASEDLARLPGTPWLIASGLNTGSPAHLYVIDTRDRSARELFPASRASAPEKAWRALCGSAPDAGSMSMDGLNARREADGTFTLLAANHGDRHAIEVFRIRLAPDPVATWTGCVPMPKGTLANSVVPLKDGGFIATSFHDPDDAQAWSRMARGEPTGSVWEWHAASGWRRLPIVVSGANGVAIDDDERTLYVSAWSARRLIVHDRATDRSRELSLDFMPDNLKRNADGSLLVGGQRARVADLAACLGPACPQPWVVARIDPASGAVSLLAQRDGSAMLNYVCTALAVDDLIYLTARGAARIGILPHAR